MNKPFFLVNQFEREERLFFAQQAQKNLIALPNRQFRQPVRIHPFQSALIAVAKRPFKSVSGKQVHIFAVAAGDKRHNAPIRPACQRQPRFLSHFAKHTFFRTFARLKLAAHAQPLVMVHIVFLFDPVEHQGASFPFNITKRCLHVVHPFPYLNVLPLSV